MYENRFFFSRKKGVHFRPNFGLSTLSHLKIPENSEMSDEFFFFSSFIDKTCGNLF